MKEKIALPTAQKYKGFQGNNMNTKLDKLDEIDKSLEEQKYRNESRNKSRPATCS